MKQLLIILTMILFALMILSQAHAMPGVSPKWAVWNANTETDLKGYFLYYADAPIPPATEPTFSDAKRVDCGLETSWSLDGIAGEFIAITAYDTSLNESGFSNYVPFDGIPPDVNSTLEVVTEQPSP